MHFQTWSMQGRVQARTTHAASGIKHHLTATKTGPGQDGLVIVVIRLTGRGVIEKYPGLNGGAKLQIMVRRFLPITNLFFLPPLRAVDVFHDTSFHRIRIQFACLLSADNSTLYKIGRAIKHYRSDTSPRFTITLVLENVIAGRGRVTLVRTSEARRSHVIIQASIAQCYSKRSILTHVFLEHHYKNNCARYLLPC